jgi:hypothetical protein
MRNVLTIAISLLCTTAALAQPAERVGQAWHNGSLMNVFTRENLVRIEYLQPKPELAAIGVVPGTVLVRGEWVAGALVATAVVFPLGCPATPYAVRGSVDAGEVLTLFGPAPALLDWNCQVLAVDWTGNSTLRFEPARDMTRHPSRSQKGLKMDSPAE